MLVQIGIPKQADSCLKSEAFTGVITISNPIVSFWSCFIFVLIPKGQNLEYFFFVLYFFFPIETEFLGSEVTSVTRQWDS